VTVQGRVAHKSHTHDGRRHRGASGRTAGESLVYATSRECDAVITQAQCQQRRRHHPSRHAKQLQQQQQQHAGISTELASAAAAAGAVSFRHKTNYRPAPDDDVRRCLVGRQGIDRAAPAYGHDV